MRFTVSFDGEEYPFEVDSEMELENLWAFVEAELDVPPPRQQLTFGTIKLAEPKRSLQSYGIHEGATIILRDTGRSSVGGSSAAGGAAAAPAVGETHHSLSSDELEDIRRIYDHILNNERVRSQLSGRFPQLVDAAFRGFDTFVPVFRRVWHEFNGMHLQHMVEHARIKENPYDVEAQRKIEEMIRLENIQRNLQEALENNPESFASVTMLYIVMEINGIRAKTFVDSGAQTTIMTPKLAERFGITRLIDERYKGIARGVGVSQIVGRVHSVQIKLGSQFLTCSFTIIESESAEVILGLDMLKRFQVNIDLKNNALVVNDEKIPFLHEYEIRQMDEEDGIVDSAAVSVAPNAQTPPGPGKARAAAVTTTVGPVSAPDAVRSGGLAAAAAAAAAASPARQRHSQEKIRLLVDLGATEEEAIRLLDQAKGNADLAASIFFG